MAEVDLSRLSTLHCWLTASQLERSLTLATRPTGFGQELPVKHVPPNACKKTGKSHSGFWSDGQLPTHLGQSLALIRHPNADA